MIRSKNILMVCATLILCVFFGCSSNRPQRKSKPKKDYTVILKDYDATIRLNPKNGDAYRKRAIAKTELKDFKGAIKDCDKAIALNPKDTLAYFVRGWAKAELGNSKGAVKDYSTAIDLDPKQAGVCFIKGREVSDTPPAPIGEEVQ
ncbi:MAG: hypothetical protein WCQ53_03620 [bacterium]